MHFWAVFHAYLVEVLKIESEVTGIAIALARSALQGTI